MQPIPFLAELEAIRRDLHAHPELSFKEFRTAAIVAEALSRYGLQVDRGLAGTGVVGRLQWGNGRRAIGLRADMDALPLSEKNVCAHRSQNEGVMHACGHDGHTAMLLGAARYLAEQHASPALDGTVYFIFQPAEESEGGAARMIAEGLFERFPMDAVFGLHNWPGLPVGVLAARSGPVMAGTSSFEITVQGQGCHAAMPHQGVDTLVAASHLVLALQTVVARNVHPGAAAVVSVTQMHGGDAWNVIPDDAVLRGTVRSFDAETQALVERAIERLCTGIAATFGARIDVRFDHHYPPTVNSVAETEFCRQVAGEVFGFEQVCGDEMPSMGAEDFAYFLREKPGCYVWLGNGPGTGGCTLHNPHYDFNDALLPLGIRYWVRLVEKALA